jgi:hypothetical protein
MALSHSQMSSWAKRSAIQPRSNRTELQVGASSPVQGAHRSRSFKDEKQTLRVPHLDPSFG